MQQPRFINQGPIYLAGLSFFGNPFQLSGDWSEENEIGRLWKRFMTVTAKQSAYLAGAVETGVSYEMHIQNATTVNTGFVEVFVGSEVISLDNLPLDLLGKVLPSTQYAVFTIQGNDITADWPRQIYHDWLPASGFKEAYPYHLQRYDQRFKGMDQISESAIDAYIPIVQS
jgi:predicted transcriptional regulator YdeE